VTDRGQRTPLPSECSFSVLGALQISNAHEARTSCSAAPAVDAPKASSAESASEEGAEGADEYLRLVEADAVKENKH
jgi:hypothetical protein